MDFCSFQHESSTNGGNLGEFESSLLLCLSTPVSRESCKDKNIRQYSCPSNAHEYSEYILLVGIWIGKRGCIHCPSQCTRLLFGLHSRHRLFGVFAQSARSKEWWTRLGSGEWSNKVKKLLPNTNNKSHEFLFWLEQGKHCNGRLFWKEAFARLYGHSWRNGMPTLSLMENTFACNAWTWHQVFKESSSVPHGLVPSRCRARHYSPSPLREQIDTCIFHTLLLFLFLCTTFSCTLTNSRNSSFMYHSNGVIDLNSHDSRERKGGKWPPIEQVNQCHAADASKETKHQ